MLTVDIITLFPEMFTGVFKAGVIGRAIERGKVVIRVHNLREYGIGKHKMVDDTPFGGGDGMVMMAEPIARALEDILGDERDKTRVILTTPQGKPYNQEKAMELAQCDRIAIVCGRYAGVDERVRLYLVDEEISIGDYVLSGGELPAMVIVDCAVRHVPGVLGNEDSPKNDSFPLLLEHAQYTRPRVWRGHAVPDVLLSGNHEEIRKWRLQDSEQRTAHRRPDLFAKYKEVNNGGDTKK